MSTLAELGLEQLPVFPFPDQLMLPLGVSEHRPSNAQVPAGAQPVEEPDAPAAIACVDEVLAKVSAKLGVSRLRTRWYQPVPVAAGEKSYERTLGFIIPGHRVVWLNTAYRSPIELARTVAHEVVHQWQDIGRGPCLDSIERRDREAEAERREETLVPKGSFKSPRGKKRDAWFEPARRRYRAKNGTRPAAQPPDVAAEALASELT